MGKNKKIVVRNTIPRHICLDKEANLIVDLLRIRSKRLNKYFNLSKFVCDKLIQEFR